MNNNGDKTNRLKELYVKYKEAKKDPRKKAGIKLLGYFIFFFILMLIASITSHLENYDKDDVITTTTTTTTLVDKYNDKQNNLLSNKYNISYYVKLSDKEYRINGTLEKNIVNGYLESSDGIKKIIIKEDNIYEVANNEESILEIGFNKEFLNLNYIINLIKQNSAIINSGDNIKTYTYDIKDIAKFIVTTNEEKIIEIKIEDKDSSYLLNFDN